MLTFERRTKSFQFRASGCAIEDWRMGIEAGGALLLSAQAQVEVLNARPLVFKLLFPTVGLVWTVHCEPEEADGRLIIRSTMENKSGSGIPLGKAYLSTYAINNRSFWTGPLRALLNQASAYYTHRKLYINDSGNVLTVDKPLPLRDAQTHATIHAMSGGPSMIGDDVDRMDEERLGLIKMTLPRSKKVAFPVDLFDSPAPDYPKIFHRKVKKSWGEFDVVAVYNFTAELLKLPVELPRLGLKDNADYLVWEFWNAEYVGRIKQNLSAVVPPGSVRVYRLVEDTGVPLLLGTDMHLLMGEMEVERCTWDASQRTFSGTVLRPAGESGNVFLYAPANLRVVNPRGHWIAKDARDNSLIIRVSLFFEDGTASWSVCFAELTEELEMSKLDLT